jgi:RNA polymerase sigma-70 factor (ECF subfamily)
LGGPTRLTDEALAARAKAGDAAAFGELVERHQEKAIGVAYSITRNFADARDVAQDAFVKAYQALGRFESRSKFTTWLYRIVTNQALDFVRRRRELPQEDMSVFESIEDGAASIEEALKDEELKAALTACVSRLPENQRKAVTLRYFAGLSVEETAKAMEIATGTVKATCFQAVGNLKKFFSEREGLGHAV